MPKIIRGSVEAAQAHHHITAQSQSTLTKSIARLEDVLIATQRGKHHVTEAYVATAIEELRGLLDAVTTAPIISSNPRHFD